MGTGGKAGAAGSNDQHDAGAGAGAGQSIPEDPEPTGPAVLRWVGRVDDSDPAAVKFSWQGAGFVANIEGAEIAVRLRTEDTDEVFFQPVIDGTPATRFKVTSGVDQDFTLATGLSTGPHRVELYRDTEGIYGMSTFLGVTRGVIAAAPAEFTRVIEVVGDSISGGYGNLGSERHPNGVPDPGCGWTAENSTWYQTYAAIAGHELDAEVSTIAISGWGMYRSYGQNQQEVLPRAYDRMFGSSAQPSWGFSPKASVVVINLGTNDWGGAGDPGTPYETAYSSFLANVRSHYPQAWLFLTIGSTFERARLDQVLARLNAVAASRAAAGDDKVLVFDLGSQDTGNNGDVPTGCNWHPNVADHSRMAKLLEKQLQLKLGW